MDCAHCKGSGIIKTPESMSLEIIRRVQAEIDRKNVACIEVDVSPEVSYYLQNRKRAQILDMEREWGKVVAIRSNSDFSNDQINFVGRDRHGRAVR